MDRFPEMAKQGIASVVRPLRLSHGALMCRNLEKSRRFYEEFLGLEVVRHTRVSMMLRRETGTYIVCVRVGDAVPEQHIVNHWGLDVASREEVDRARAEAQRLQTKYEIRQIKRAIVRHRAYGFYLHDLDNNWWEIQHEPRTIDQFFDRGDVV
ncbi:MAG TPA: VOC family protein [Burkholderiales bacterium]|nr:VOC family protein [Burkholderiales bacterium]